MKPVLMFYKPTGAGRQKRTKAASDAKANRRTETPDRDFYRRGRRRDRSGGRERRYASGGL